MQMALLEAKVEAAVFRRDAEQAAGHGTAPSRRRGQIDRDVGADVASPSHEGPTRRRKQRSACHAHSSSQRPGRNARRAARAPTPPVEAGAAQSTRGPRRRRGEVPFRSDDPTSFFCGNLPWDVAEEQLRRLFGGKGVVLCAQLLRTKGGKPAGCGFVRMSSSTEAAEIQSGTWVVAGRRLRFGRPIRATKPFETAPPHAVDEVRSH